MPAVAVTEARGANRCGGRLGVRTGAAMQAQGSAAVQWLSQGSASAESGSVRAQHRESAGWCRRWQWLRQLVATSGGEAGAVKN